MQDLIKKTEKALESVLDKVSQATEAHNIRDLSQGATELARTLELLRKQ